MTHFRCAWRSRPRAAQSARAATAHEQARRRHTRQGFRTRPAGTCAAPTSASQPCELIRTHDGVDGDVLQADLHAHVAVAARVDRLRIRLQPTTRELISQRNRLNESWIAKGSNQGARQMPDREREPSQAQASSFKLSAAGPTTISTRERARQGPNTRQERTCSSSK